MLLITTPSTWQLWCFSVLGLVMLMLVETDLREHRIPNAVVLLLLGAGLTLNIVGPDNGRGGVFGHYPGALGAGPALLGVLVGLLIFLPFYLLRAMGAGDVKLMAALGAFAGPVEVISLALSILVAGGLLAVLRMLLKRNSQLVLSNVKWVLSGLGRGASPRFDPATQSIERMPYALAFAAGLVAYGYWRLTGGMPLIGY